MTVIQKEASVRFETASYTIEASENAISVILAGEEVACLQPSSAVDTMVRKEDGTAVTASDCGIGGLTFSYVVENGTPTVIWTGRSASWDNTEYILRAYETHAEYCIRVRGKGDVDSIYYFSGRDASYIGSTYEFDTGYMPVPTVNGARQCEFSAQESFTETPALTVPPLFCYVFDICGMEPKLALALAAKTGEHNFTKFDYRTRSRNFTCRFWLMTDPAGHVHVDGTWESPSILIFGAPGRREALAFYADYYYSTGRAVRKDPDEKKPRFWYGPMACGWIEQNAQYLRYHEANGCQDMARQTTYDRFRGELEKRDLHPKILIIDDKWQVHYGLADADTEKWPDLRGWIDRMHDEHGCHVMLWFKLWDDEGLPDDCCIIDRKTGARWADPTSPAYDALLKEMMHRLLSSDEGCYNAYGLKLDYAFMQPAGRDAVSRDGRYGVELYLELIRKIYRYAKEAKPEAVISGSPCHPLFAPYIDHARLHDYWTDLRRCYEEFSFRKSIYEIAVPGVLFDTDGAGFSSRRDTVRYMTLAPEIGIPDIYCVTDMPVITVTDEDWAKVAAAWRKYEERIDRMMLE